MADWLPANAGTEIVAIAMRERTVRFILLLLTFSVELLMFSFTVELLLHLDDAQGKVACVSGRNVENELFVRRRGSERPAVSHSTSGRENRVKALNYRDPASKRTGQA